MTTRDEELHSLSSIQKARFYWWTENAIYSCCHRVVNVVKAM